MSEATNTNHGWRTFLSVVILLGVGFLGWLALSVYQLGLAQSGMRVQITQMQMQLQGVATIRTAVAHNQSDIRALHAEHESAARRINRLEQGSDKVERWTR